MKLLAGAEKQEAVLHPHSRHDGAIDLHPSLFEGCGHDVKRGQPKPQGHSTRGAQSGSEAAFRDPHSQGKDRQQVAADHRAG